MTLFKSNYSKAIMYLTLRKSNYSKNNYSKHNYSNIIHEAATTQAIFNFTCGYRTLYTCTKRLEKKKFAPQARFFLNTRAETIVSGAKNMVNRPKK